VTRTPVGRTCIDWARLYYGRGWQPIPIPLREKNPGFKAWEQLRLDADTLELHFNGHPQNIGVLLGAPSANLVDIDLDCPEAVQLARDFLPPTGRFGRLSKRASHWLYTCDPPPNTKKWQDAAKDHDGRTVTLVELRSTGCQTIFPGSTHPSGETIEWEVDGDPVKVDGRALQSAVAELASAALLARHWPGPGTRHDAALALAGLLAREGIGEANAQRLIRAIAKAARDDEADDRVRAFESTFRGTAEGRPVTGGPTLASLLVGEGEKVVKQVRRWLELSGDVARDGHDADTVGLSDLEIADRFVAEFGRDSFRFCYDQKSWFMWDTTHWRRDLGDAVMKTAEATALILAAEYPKFTGKLKSAGTLYTMVGLTRHKLAIAPAQLDADPWLLCCPNGVVDLRTGQLREHRREDYITLMTAAEYHPEARHELWERFLVEALPDAGARDYAQRYAGYCLTGLMTEDVFVFLIGPAGSGKSTFLEALRRTWGGYAKTADFSSFLAARTNPGGPRDDLARLAGSRLVTSVETKDGQRLADGLLKALTGGDTVSARRVYERTIEFPPTFKFLFASNFRPRANAFDDGIWRRLRELPFLTARLRREERDPTVRATLIDPRQAGSAILAWAVDGCLRWQREGLGEPPAVMAASLAYRRSQDPLAGFVAACCVLGPTCSVTASRLRGAYEAWAKENGIPEQDLIRGIRWGEALEALGCRQDRTSTARKWVGIALVESPPRGPMPPGPDYPDSFRMAFPGVPR
jgi:P4 family phage/plasmid primase-like protien